MPYEWTKPRSNHSQQSQLDLWPHSSLPNKGFAAFILTTFLFISLPLYPVLGTAVFWGLLPFLMITVGAIWVALRKNYADRTILEQLTLSDDQIHLIRQNPNGKQQTWECNAFWARVHMHETGGPVRHYVTLSGNGREVELGAFLSEEERKALYSELGAFFHDIRTATKPIQY